MLILWQQAGASYRFIISREHAKQDPTGVCGLDSTVLRLRSLGALFGSFVYEILVVEAATAAVLKESLVSIKAVRMNFGRDLECAPTGFNDPFLQ